MNDEDVHIIKTTWEKPMQDPNGSGQAILIEYFTQFPSALKYFEAFRDVPVAELNDNPRFKAHAGRIIRLFNDSINALGTDYADSAIQDLWKKIAVSHHKRKITKQNFSDLKGVILKILTVACDLNERQGEAWVKFLDHAYEIVFSSYDELDNGAQ